MSATTEILPRLGGAAHAIVAGGPRAGALGEAHAALAGEPAASLVAADVVDRGTTATQAAAGARELRSPLAPVAANAATTAAAEVARLHAGIDAAAALVGRPGVSGRDVLQAIAPMLAEIGRGSAVRLGPAERGQLARAAGAVLHRLDGAARAGVVLSDPARTLLEGTTRLASRTLDGDGVSLTREAGALYRDLLRPDRRAFLQRLDRIGQVAALDDLELMRFAAASELRRQVPSVAGNQLRTAQLRQRWTEVADAARRLRAPGTGSDVSTTVDAAASSSAGPHPMVASAGDRVPLGIGWDALGAKLLGDAATRATPSLVDRALRRAFDVAPTAGADKVHAAGLGRVRSALPSPATDATLAVRLRHHAAAIDAALAAADGEAHAAPMVDRYVGSLAGLVDGLVAVPHGLRTALAPRVVDDALGELARGLVALRERGADGQLHAERLWPDRGRLGRVLAGSRVLADVHESMLAAGATPMPEAI